MMADIVLQVLKLSVLTSLLIGLLLLLIPLLQKRYRAKWRYLAWIVIAVRLLIPVSLSFPQAPIQIPLPEQAAAVMVPVAANIPSQPQSQPSAGAEESVVSGTVAPSTAKASLPLLQIVGRIWLAGVLLFLAVQIVSYQVFMRKLKFAQVETIPPSFKETIWQIGVQMGICTLPEPIITKTIDAPVLVGVLHPRVLLPHTDYTDEEFSFILHHELVHYRRRDMWYKLILLLANALHWFNPLVYLMTIQAAKDIELACDDDVIRELDRDARAKYGSTILSALPGKRRLEPVFSTHFGSTKKNMKSRLRNLFDTAVKRRGIAALCTVAVCAATVTGMVTFSTAAAKPDSIPAIADTHTFSVSSIQPGEVVCIGEIALGPDISYSGTFAVESGSNPMIALYDQPNVTHSAGIGWHQSFGGTDSKIWFSSNTPQIAYVYVGSSGTTRLTGVTGSIERQAIDTSPPLQPQPAVETDASSYISDEDGRGVTDLTLHVTAANVIVRLSADDNFHYQYNSDTHAVKTSGSGAARVITVTAKQRDNMNFPSFINIEIPNRIYQQITYLGSAAGLNLPAINANIKVDVSASSCILPIPAGYNKTCTFSANSSSGILEFEKGAANYTFSLNATAAAPLLPSSWPTYRYGQTYTHSNGSGQGIITATVNASSFIVETDTEPEAKEPVGTINNPATFDRTDPDVKGTSVINLRNNSGQKNLVQSGSFQAGDGQTLTVTATSSIKGGTVDLFLTSPSYQEKRITFGGSNTTQTIELSAGTWAYNCTGFFESGDIVITGTTTNTAPVSGSSTSTAADKEGIRIMEQSGTWSQSINRLLPNMSPAAVEKVVDIYLERHLFPNITQPQSAKQVAATIEPALQYMTKEARESASRRIAVYY